MEISKLIYRTLAVWLTIICAETIHGILRVVLLQPLLGDFRARQIAVFTGAIIILTISTLFIRWLNAKNFTHLILIGLIWLLLTISFEVLLGRLVLDLSWERVFSDYNVAQGGLLPFGLLILLFAPLIASKIRRLV